ncbi:MAG: hypothetical protein H0T73_09680, partial [Ardenticatenales bacterium]|nr:hypothetical protein [Ardenticatenales bacterium]
MTAPYEIQRHTDEAAEGTTDTDFLSSEDSPRIQRQAVEEASLSDTTALGEEVIQSKREESSSAVTPTATPVVGAPQVQRQISEGPRVAPSLPGVSGQTTSSDLSVQGQVSQKLPLQRTPTPTAAAETLAASPAAPSTPAASTPAASTPSTPSLPSVEVSSPGGVIARQVSESSTPASTTV